MTRNKNIFFFNLRRLLFVKVNLHWSQNQHENTEQSPAHQKRIERHQLSLSLSLNLSLSPLQLNDIPQVTVALPSTLKKRMGKSSFFSICSDSNANILLNIIDSISDMQR